jgi:septum formation protein
MIIGFFRERGDFEVHGFSIAPAPRIISTQSKAVNRAAIMIDRRLLLASTSKYRAELLGRLGLPFETAAPGVDETPLPGEEPRALALRLARAKAQVLAPLYPETLIIGSDQVLAHGHEKLGKPGDHAAAVRQLRSLSAATVIFHTAVCVVDTSNGRSAEAVTPISVRFRHLSDDLIERYLRAEKPYDVAGSAKSEGLGVALLQSVESSDPTALVGLPLIVLIDLLAELDYPVFDQLGR